MKKVIHIINNSRTPLYSIENIDVQRFSFRDLHGSLNIDESLHSFLVNEIWHGVDESCDYCFVIETSLRESILDSIGIRLAMHIRLTENVKGLQSSPIILTSTLDKNQIRVFSDCKDILDTKGTYFSGESQNKIDEYIELFRNEKLLRSNSLNELKEKIKIPPPENYLSRHSLSNEWAIVNWAKTLGLPFDDKLLSLEAKITSSLFYKNQSLKPWSDEVYNGFDEIENKKISVLYVDDDLNKGWDKILNHICVKKRIDFIPCEPANSDATDSDEVVAYYFDQILKNKPDIIVLDLRLHREDHFTTDPDEITGLILLDKIKSRNPGIQVIHFSATTRIGLALLSRNLGSDAFIQKRTFQGWDDLDEFYDSIEKLDETLSNLSKKNKIKYLYPGYEKAFNFLNDPSAYVDDVDDDFEKFTDNVKILFEVGFKLLIKINPEDNDSLMVTYISFFGILEVLKNEYLHDKDNRRKFEYRVGNRYEDKQDRTEVRNYFISEGDHKYRVAQHDHKKKYPSMPSIICSIVNEFHGSVTSDTDITKLIRCIYHRNEFVHTRNGKVTPVSIEKLFDLVDLCTKISIGLKP